MDPPRKMVMHARRFDGFRGALDQRLQVSKGGNRVVGLSKVRRNSLAKRLAQVQPQPDLSTKQVNEDFRVNVAKVAVAAALRRLDSVEPLVNVKFLRVG